MKLAARILICLAMALLCTLTLADDGAIEGVGGAIQLLDEHPSVIMEKMLVNIDLYSDRALVDCLFEFRNTGPETTVRTGFPERGTRAPKEGQPTGFISFATWVDGKPLSTSIEGFRVEGRSVDWRRWRVKQVGFGEGQTRTVRVLYESELTDVSDGSRYLEYEVHTGASWKGPIGLCRVLLRLHYDPGRERFEVSQPFRRVGLNSFEWVQHNFEPPAGYDIRVNCFPWFGELIVNDVTESLGPIRAPYPYIEDGLIWAQVRGLARWINAELFSQATHTILIKGRHVVTLWKHSSWMEHNGERVRLPGATRVEQGRLMIPLAVVARVLEADVSFDPQIRALRITTPPYRQFAAILGPDAARAALRALPPSWAPLESTDFSLDVLESARRQTGGEPWMCSGDFDGNGLQDLALLLRGGAQHGTAVLKHSQDAGGHAFVVRWVCHGYPRPSLDGKWTCRLQTRSPGPVEYRAANDLDDWTEEDWKTGQTGQKSGRLDLKHDGIEIIGKSATMMCYRDHYTGRYEMLQTAD